MPWTKEGISKKISKILCLEIPPFCLYSGSDPVWCGGFRSPEAFRGTGEETSLGM